MYSPPPAALILEKYAEISLSGASSYTVSSVGIYLIASDTIHLIDAEYYHSPSSSWVKVGSTSGSLDYGMQVQPNFISDGQNARVYNRGATSYRVIIMRCR